MQSTLGSAADCWADFSKFKVEKRHLDSAVQSAGVVCQINNTGVMLRQLEAFFGGAREDRFICRCLVSLSHVVVFFFKEKKIKFSFALCKRNEIFTI